MSQNIYTNGQLLEVAGKYAVDSELSTTSTNAVQNKIVTASLNNCAYMGTQIGASEAVPVNADLLGGKYTADDITEINEKLSDLCQSDLGTEVTLPYTATADGVMHIEFVGKSSSNGIVTVLDSAIGRHETGFVYGANSAGYSFAIASGHTYSLLKAENVDSYTVYVN